MGVDEKAQQGSFLTKQGKARGTYKKSHLVEQLFVEWVHVTGEVT